MTTLKTLALTIGCLVAAGTANGGIVIGFETSEGYVAGALSDPNRSGNEVQAGWSDGAQTGFRNNDPGDEQVVATEAHRGAHRHQFLALCQRIRFFRSRHPIFAIARFDRRYGTWNDVYSRDVVQGSFRRWGRINAKHLHG